MTIVVTGGRTYTWTELIHGRLDKVHAEDPITLLVEGGAAGMDTESRSWAIINDVKYVTVRAKWSIHGHKAGPLRNQEMLDEYSPQACVASPGGAGTADMRRRCQAAGIRIIEVE